MPLDSPLLLSPVFKPKIWGRKDLSPLFTCPKGRTALSADPTCQFSSDEKGAGLIGEAWLTDDKARFLNGPVAGMTLGEASQKYGPELYGGSWPDHPFPILAKYIFTSDWLSVQVHPDDRYARTHDPGNLGKCEMWYIVRRDQNAEILLGLKSGASKEALKKACEEGNSMSLLNRFTPKHSEAIFVPPGTVHALGAGLVLFEAEQNSDLTYRLDDFGRRGLDGKPRPLHWDKGMDVIRTELPVYRNLPRLEFRAPFGSRRYVLASRFFAVEELTLRKAAYFESAPKRVEILSLLAGGGRMETRAGWLACRTGDTWIIPPGTRQYRLVPEKKTRLLKFYVPDLDSDFRRPLAKRGIRADQIRKVVFD